LTRFAELPQYSRDYLDPQKRSVANAVQVFFKDGSKTTRMEVEYPLGHPRRRAEGLPLLRRKCETNLATRLSDRQVRAALDLWDDPERIERMPVEDFVGWWVVAKRSWAEQHRV
jgi:2-methylcitrate dehydratase